MLHSSQLWNSLLDFKNLTLTDLEDLLCSLHHLEATLVLHSTILEPLVLLIDLDEVDLGYDRFFRKFTSLKQTIETGPSWSKVLPKLVQKTVVTNDPPYPDDKNFKKIS